MWQTDTRCYIEKTISYIIVAKTLQINREVITNDDNYYKYTKEKEPYRDIELLDEEYTLIKAIKWEYHIQVNKIQYSSFFVKSWGTASTVKRLKISFLTKYSNVYQSLQGPEGMFQQWRYRFYLLGLG